MDRASRNFLALASIALTLVGYGFCGVIAYGFLPLLQGRTGEGFIGLLAVICLGALLTLPAVLAARALRREAAATRGLSRRIEAAALAPPPGLRLAALEAGLATRITLVDSQESCSFVYGALMPRVAISSGFLARLSAEELRAALEHERYHVQRLDPLRSTLASAAVEALFFLPALRILYKRYETARELAADRRAASVCGARPLAGALLKAIDGAVATERPATVPLAGPQLIDLRLAQLETGREPKLIGFGLLGLGGSALGALASLALFIAAPLATGGSADVGGALARELAPGVLLEGAALCLVPIAVAMGWTYWRLSLRSSSPL